MQHERFSRMRGGWFVGDFEPTAYRTPACEVAYKTHTAGETWPAHTELLSVEINLLIEGRLRIGDHVFAAGDIFIVQPGEIVKPHFLRDCRLVVVKIPSAPHSKVILAE